MTDEFHNTLISQIGGDIEESDDDILDEDFDDDIDDDEDFDGFDEVEEDGDNM
jgi:hypothetical protein